MNCSKGFNASEVSEKIQEMMKESGAHMVGHFQGCTADTIYNVL